MKILLIYPGHQTSTIDVATGYEQALMRLGHQVKAYDYHNALTFYRMAFASWVKANPGAKMHKNADFVLASEHVAIEALDFAPDVVLIVTGTALHRRAFELLHCLSLPLALLLTESPYSDEVQSVIMTKGHISVAFANDQSSVIPLTEASGVKTVYLPHSYNPDVHRIRGAIRGYETDVFFHGTMFPERVEMLEPLLDLPYDVHVGGPDPSFTIEGLTDEEVEDALDEHGEHYIDNHEMSYYYNGTNIAVNNHRTFIGVLDGERHISNGAAYSIGPRTYEIAACGAFQLCDDTRPELQEVFGDSVAVYSDRDDLIQKICYFLNHEDERQEMAQNAFERVRDCTFERRAEQILIPTLMEVI